MITGISIKVTYNGKPDAKRDEEIKKIMAASEFIGCGYNFETNVRDLGFIRNIEKKD